jgi:hypothetical protein
VANDVSLEVATGGFFVLLGANPSFRIGGTKVILHPLEMVSVPVDQP